jgi:hypothetical protein
MTLDLAAVNAYGRPIVQPTAATPGANGIRPVQDPREATIPASPLAVRNGPELRQSVGPRRSSSAADTSDHEERSTVQGRGRGGGGGSTASSKPRGQALDEDDGRGNTVDVTV